MSDVSLRGCQIEPAGADQYVEVFFQSVLHMGIPLVSGIRLGPDITDIVRSSQFGRDQKADFIRVGPLNKTDRGG